VTAVLKFARNSHNFTASENVLRRVKIRELVICRLHSQSAYATASRCICNASSSSGDGAGAPLNSTQFTRIHLMLTSPVFQQSQQPHHSSFQHHQQFNTCRHSLLRHLQHLVTESALAVQTGRHQRLGGLSPKLPT